MLIILLLFFIFFIVFFLFLYLVDVNIIDSNYIQQLLQFFCVSYSFVSKVSVMRNAEMLKLTGPTGKTGRKWQ